MATTTFEKPMGSEVETLKSQIGTLSSLTTSAKSSAVAAINEVNAKIPNPINNYYKGSNYPDRQIKEMWIASNGVEVAFTDANDNGHTIPLSSKITNKIEFDVIEVTATTSSSGNVSFNGSINANKFVACFAVSPNYAAATPYCYNNYIVGANVFNVTTGDVVSGTSVTLNVIKIV